MRRIKHLSYSQLATMSEYELDSRRAACISRGKTWSIASVACISCVLVVIGVAMVPALRIAMASDATTALVASLVIVSFMIIGFALDAFCSEPVRAWARELAPLAESESGCFRLLAAAREFPEVKLWVDGAVSNGRQLRSFDLAAAEELSSEGEALRKERHDAACRELHGLTIAN